MHIRNTVTSTGNWQIDSKYYFLSDLEIIKDVTKEILRRNPRNDILVFPS